MTALYVFDEPTMTVYVVVDRSHVPSFGIHVNCVSESCKLRMRNRTASPSQAVASGPACTCKALSTFTRTLSVLVQP